VYNIAHHMYGTKTALPLLFTAGMALMGFLCTSTHGAEAISVPAGAASDVAVPQNDGLLRISLPENPAVAELREAIRLDPTHANAHYELGVELYRSGQIVEGIAELREAIRLQPGHIDARYYLAKALIKERDGLVQTETTRGATSREPVLAEAYLELAKALIASGDFPQAVMEVREALRLEPNFAEAHATLGFAYFNMGDVESATDEYRTVVRLKPASGMSHLNLATALMAKHDWASARTELQEALRLQPDLVQAQYSLGAVAYTLGDIAAAIDAYRKTLKLKADYAEAHYSLGLLLKLTNREAEARQAFFAAAEAGLPKAQYFLGNAYASGLGTERNFTQAMTWWLRAAEQGMQPAWEALAHLRRTATLNVKQSPDEARAVLMAFQELRQGIWREFFPDLENTSQESAGMALLGRGQWQQAISVLIREAYALNELAETQLEAIYEEGIEGQVPAHDSRVLAYFKAMAPEGSPRPRIMLARIYAKGWGVPQDVDKAIGLLRGSQDEEARRMLKKLSAIQQEIQATKQKPATPVTQ
jgi:Flp pilus assembly protein TadD